MKNNKALNKAALTARLRFLDSKERRPIKEVSSRLTITNLQTKDKMWDNPANIKKVLLPTKTKINNTKTALIIRPEERVPIKIKVIKRPKGERITIKWMRMDMDLHYSRLISILKITERINQTQNKW
jgi:hypothetical protein